MHWKILLVSPNQAMASSLLKIIGEKAPTAGLLEVPVYAPAHTLAELIQAHGCNGFDLCFDVASLICLGARAYPHGTIR